MKTGTSILIQASPKQIFDTVCDLERWPAQLPHYRWVKTLEHKDGLQIVEMAASRDGIPISWVSAYRCDPQRCELHFEHLRKFTKGMKVLWTMTPTDSGTRVDIFHELNFRIPALAWLAEPIIGGFFIDNIANKTLRTFKTLIEAAGNSGKRP